jgi:hypothetical protein
MQTSYKGVVFDLTWDEQQQLDMELSKLLALTDDVMEFPITHMIFKSL